MHGTLNTSFRFAAVLLLFAGTAVAQAGPPVSTIHGNTGLWKVLVADTVPYRQASVAITFDRGHRNPGGIIITTFTFGAAVGLTNRLEAGIVMEAYRHVRVRAPEQLSFGQQALGLFGQKSPGSSPLPSELMPGSSRVPQLRSPESTAGQLTGQAGYYNLVPFAGLVPAAGAAGYVTLGVKYNLFSESRTAPLGLAVHSYLSIPIHKGIDYLMTHPVGTADLHFGFNVIASRDIARRANIHWNAGYRHISQPAHASVFRLSDELPLGIGFSIPRTGRVQFVAESLAEIFIGRHTPNRTVGPADPVDIAAGLRVFAGPLLFSAAYQPPVQGGENKHGFVTGVSFNTPNR